MPADVALGIPALYGFMLVLARVSGVFAFVSLPGFQSAPRMARIVLPVLITLALFPLWPQVDAARADAPRLLAFLAGLLFLLPWMLQRAMGYTIALFGDLSRYAH